MNEKEHIQYFCFAGVTRSVMAENLSRKLDPSLTFSSAGYKAIDCWKLATDDRISYLSDTALAFLNNPDNDFSYTGGSQIRDYVEKKASDLQLDSLDMQRVSGDKAYAEHMRSGLQDLLKEGLAPNEVLLRNLVLEEYGVTPEYDNVQLEPRTDVGLYLAMTLKLSQDATDVIGHDNVYFVGNYANAKLEEPDGNLFAVGQVEPYVAYAKQLHDVVLPKVIEKTVGGKR